MYLLPYSTIVTNAFAQVQKLQPPAAKEPTGTAPVPTVDVENLPYEALTPLESPDTDAKVKFNGRHSWKYCKWLAAALSHHGTIVKMNEYLKATTCMGPHVQAALTDMGSGDWAVACRGLLIIRRLSKHHKQECRALL
jgi:hypothetical protein